MNQRLLPLALLVLPGIAGAWTLDKTPDLGDYWYPLGVAGNTSIYANSFVFNGSSSDASLTKLGVHLRLGGGSEAPLKYFLLADGGNAPTPTILSTGFGTVGTSSGSLVLLTQAMSSVTLVPGTRYWVAAQAQAAGGFYQVGAHTQNSVQSDNGTFWYSNPNSFSDWDGQGLTPEMGIYVETVPEPATMAALALGAGALARRRRR